MNKYINTESYCEGQINLGVMCFFSVFHKCEAGEGGIAQKAIVYLAVMKNGS
jgi:hypothetical protein